MAHLINKLNRRIMFLTPVQTPNSAGGATQTYKQLTRRCWAGFVPVSTSAGSYVRDVQIEDAPTHKFTVRRNTHASIDVYGEGVVKSDNFVFVLMDNLTGEGRLFRILKASNVDEADESIDFLAKEIGALNSHRGIIQ